MSLFCNSPVLDPSPLLWASLCLFPQEGDETCILLWARGLSVSILRSGSWKEQNLTPFTFGEGVSPKLHGSSCDKTKSRYFIAGKMKELLNNYFSDSQNFRTQFSRCWRRLRENQRGFTFVTRTEAVASKFLAFLFTEWLQGSTELPTNFLFID